MALKSIPKTLLHLNVSLSLISLPRKSPDEVKFDIDSKLLGLRIKGDLPGFEAYYNDFVESLKKYVFVPMKKGINQGQDWMNNARYIVDSMWVSSSNKKVHFTETCPKQPCKI